MTQLFRRKPILDAAAAEALDPQAPVVPGLRRALNAWQLTALGIGEALVLVDHDALSVPDLL